jgi:hypothetical protein
VVRPRERAESAQRAVAHPVHGDLLAVDGEGAALAEGDLVDPSASRYSTNCANSPF